VHIRPHSIKSNFTPPTIRPAARSTYITMLSTRTFFKAARSPSLARNFSAQSARQNLARITLIGRLPADAELVQSGNGKEFVRYAVGHSIRKANGEEKTSWFRVSAFVEDRSKEYVLGLKKGYVVVCPLHCSGTIGADPTVPFPPEPWCTLKET
jgi:hypothetical protein